MYIYVSNLTKYLYYREQSNDYTRKWSWKKESNVSYSGVERQVYVYNLKKKCLFHKEKSND